jgi:hypothetical protein
MHLWTGHAEPERLLTMNAAADDQAPAPTRIADRVLSGKFNLPARRNQRS